MGVGVLRTVSYLFHMTNKSKGWLLVALPWIGMIFVFVSFYIRAVLARVVLSQGGDVMVVQTVFRAVNVVLGFVGILSVLGVPVGLVAGIIVMTTTEKSKPPSV